MRLRFSFVLAGMALLGLGTGPAAAVPVYVVQSGQACDACHVGGFGPQVTSLGRQFKLEGYTMRASTNFTAPISAMASYVQISSAQPSPPAPHYATNDNLTPNQASLFVAGGIGDQFGGFTLWT